MRLGAIIVIGVSIVAVSAKVLPALPQSDDVRSFDAGYLEAAVFIEIHRGQCAGRCDGER